MESTRLDVYQHQVGGHVRLLKPEGVPLILKPLIANEWKFYQVINDGIARGRPSETMLANYIPAYFGVRNVCIRSSSYPKTPSPKNQSLVGHQKQPHLVCQGAQGRAEIENSLYTDCKKLASPENSAEVLQTPRPLIPERRHAESLDFGQSSRRRLLEWTASENWHQEDRANGRLAIKSDTDTLSCESTWNGSAREYLVITDLLHGYTKPCIIDIKLGRLQRTVSSTAAKRWRQMRKSLESTSYTLGFRVCGCQSYDHTTEALLFQDKYFGRKLDKKRLVGVFRGWLHDGRRYNYEVLVVLIEKLKGLIEAVEEMSSYRFWSTSLLCYYEGGDMSVDDRKKSVNAKMVDFAHVVRSLDSQPDLETLGGLTNLQIIFCELLWQIQKSVHPKSLPKHENRRSSTLPPIPYFPPAPAGVVCSLNPPCPVLAPPYYTRPLIPL